MKKTILNATFFTIASVIYMTPSFSETRRDNDKVVLSFSTVGDSRQDPKNPDPSVVQNAQIAVGKCPQPFDDGLIDNPGLSGQDCKWLQNTKAWARIMNSIQTQKPNLLFFNGDMINGYGKASVPVIRGSKTTPDTEISNPNITDLKNSDFVQFYTQYGFWRGMVANLMETGTYLVPVPGNHEVQCIRCGKTAQVENENAWRDNMGDLILDQSRFTFLLGQAPQHFDLANNPGIADGVTTDQAQLSYSFDVGTSHFTIINTDAVGKDGYAPTKWLDADLLAAEGHGSKHLFVFGHKPAVFYKGGPLNAPNPSKTASLNDTDPVAAAEFWNVIDHHKATYFCGHEHTYNVSRPFNAKSLQVLVGAAGSDFEWKSSPVASDRMYSWATVKIFKSGKVVMNTYGFDDTIAHPVVNLETITLANH
jgi:Calcineurin-like phosphoesterase